MNAADTIQWFDLEDEAAARAEVAAEEAEILRAEAADDEDAEQKCAAAEYSEPLKLLLSSQKIEVATETEACSGSLLSGSYLISAASSMR